MIIKILFKKAVNPHARRSLIGRYVLQKIDEERDNGENLYYLNDFWAKEPVLEFLKREAVVEKVDFGYLCERCGGMGRNFEFPGFSNCDDCNGAGYLGLPRFLTKEQIK